MNKLKSFIFLLCLPLSFVCSAQKTKIFFTINPIECVACINALSNIEYLDSTIDFYFVFEEKYQVDSALLIKNFYLNHYDAKFIWSDELYKKMINNGISTVKIESSDENNTQGTILKDFSKKIAEDFNKLSAITDTIDFKNTVFTSGVDDFSLFDQYVCFSDKLRNSISVYSILSEKLEFKFKVNDALVKKAFTITNREHIYEQNEILLDDLKVPNPHSFESLYMRKDTLYALMKCEYFQIEGNDTILYNFQVMHKVYDGKLVSTNTIEQEFINELDIYSFSSSFAILENGDMTASVSKSKIGTNKNYFLAVFKNVNQQYVFDHFINESLPVEYENYDYARSTFYGDFAAIPLKDRLYSLHGKNSNFDINHFPKNNKIIDGFPKNFIYSFKTDENYIWMIYSDNDKPAFYAMKFDKKNKKIIWDKELKAQKRPVFDDFDHNYILYKFNDQILIRQNLS